MAVIVLTCLVPGAASLPSIVVTAPLDGSVCLSRPVLITGNATGSELWWNQSAPADFNGSYNGTNATAGGEPTLPNGSYKYDDFNDNSLDASKWTVSSASGSWTFNETGNELKVTGTASSGTWVAYGRLQSPVNNYTDVSALIKVQSSSGSGHGAWLEFYKDSQNYFYWGYTYDTNTGTSPDYLAWGRLSSGSGSWGKYNTSGSGYHRFRMIYDVSQSDIGLYVDGIYIGHQSLSMSSWKISLYSSIRDSSSSIDARFDDVRIESPRAGNYTSKPYDSLMTAPQLNYVNWTAVTPGGTNASVYLRSSDSAQMTAPTSWYRAGKGQTDFTSVLFKRYIQYRVELHTTSPEAHPVFQALKVKLFKPVVKVEASLDQFSWATATGTTSWSLNMNLPEGAQTVFVRVTDAVGETSTTTVRVMVDTVKAALSLTLDQGAGYATSPCVTATMTWSGPVTIASFQLSDYPDFDGAVWKNITPAPTWTLPAGDGTKTVHARLRDIYGLVSNSAQDTIILDTVPPKGTIDIRTSGPVQIDPVVNLSLSANDVNGINGMQLSNTGSFDGVDWVPFTPSLRWTLSPGVGVRTVYARFRDSAGLVSGTVNDTVLLSGEGAADAPGATMVIGDGSGFATEENVPVHISISNGTASWMMIAADVGFTGAAWRPFTPEFVWRLSTGDGTKLVYARLASPQGAVFYAYATVVLDTTPPAGSISINDGAAETRSPMVKLDLVASDANGVVDMRIGETADFGDAGWRPFADTVDWTFEAGEGNRTVHAVFRDAAGWVSGTVAASIRLLPPLPPPDPVPYGNISLNGGAKFARSNGVTLSLWLDNSALSSKARMRISNSPDISGDDWTPFSASMAWRLFPGQGNRTVYAVFSYRNETSPVVTGSIIIDSASPPLPVFDDLPATTTNSSIRLAGQCEPGATLTLNGRHVALSPSGRFETPMSLSMGTNSITVRIEDEAGNNASTVVKVVRTAPVSEPTGPDELPVSVSGLDFLWILLAIVLLACIGVAVGARLLMRRGQMQQEGEAGAGMDGAFPETAATDPAMTVSPEPYERFMTPTPPPMRPAQGEVRETGEPSTAPPSTLAANADGEKLTIVHSVNVDDLEDEDRPRAPAETPGGRFPETVVLRSITSLPRGIPSSLGGWDLEELAAAISSGEYRTTPDGDLLVRIGARWYFGDPANSGTYLQVYRGK